MTAPNIYCPNCQRYSPAVYPCCPYCGWGRGQGPPRARPLRAQKDPVKAGVGWALLGFMLTGLFVLGGLFFLGSFAAALSPPTRVHASDVRQWTGDGLRPLVIRCPACNGTRYSAHFGHTGDGTQPEQYYRDGTIPCPPCRGTGETPVTMWKRVVVVPDSEPSSYH